MPDDWVQDAIEKEKEWFENASDEDVEEALREAGYYEDQYQSVAASSGEVEVVDNPLTLSQTSLQDVDGGRVSFEYNTFRLDNGQEVVRLRQEPVNMVYWTYPDGTLLTEFEMKILERNYQQK